LRSGLHRLIIITTKKKTSLYKILGRVILVKSANLSELCLQFRQIGFSFCLCKIMKSGCGLDKTQICQFT